jgi:uncharacterized protein
MTPFYGRTEELKLLTELVQKRAASLVVIKGRRRIGKSRLIQEFGKSVKNCKTYFFSGMAPTARITAQMEREDFAKQMHRQLGVPGLEKLEDWGDLFWHLAHQTKEGRVLVVLDEINWMGSKDPTFLSKLKTAWDLYFKTNPKLILILSGSMSTWIEDNIIGSSGFLGRISLDMTLQELPLHQCNHFWQPREKLIAPYEKFKVLSITGGVPRYLEEIHPEWTAEKNIQRLCFQKEGLLFKEFEKIFNDLFVRSGEAYKTILKALAEKNLNLDEICRALEFKKGGTVSRYLDNLVLNEYVSKDRTWDLTSGKESKLSRYRLKDNYLRFYLKYIEPIKGRIERGSLSSLPNWETIMGLQFENLVLNNRRPLFQKLGIPLSDIVNENPFFQQKTKKQAGCQIDYMVQTKFNTLYLCEIKFSREKIPSKVIQEVETKIEHLSHKKRFSVRPVLIHVNGVAESVAESDFFSSIHDFSELLIGE